MSSVKYIEIRDRATFISAVAVKLCPELEADAYLHRRMGWGGYDEPVYLIWEDAHKAYADPYAWGENPRTMFRAHQYIEEHFEALESGSVVDVEYILHESAEPKKPEKKEMSELGFSVYDEGEEYV